MMTRTLVDLRAQAKDFVKRINPEIKHVKENDMIITYMAAFAFEVLKLQEAGMDWRVSDVEN
jgi:hypothetical protein